ncbi:hypothetical protein [Methanosarcina sp. MTP4]|uniref:hypothetical protein n=1 Tax=Methanosarcina sp. MTP4 TaxID=1434100 RepID=UPI000A7983A6|nr:hypothetical protein [Methanosarcina sp. MTP4]
MEKKGGAGSKLSNTGGSESPCRKLCCKHLLPVSCGLHAFSSTIPDIIRQETEADNTY